MPRTTTRKRKYRARSKTRAKRATRKRKRVTRRAKSRTRRVKKTTKKAIAKRKRRVKLINKTIKRVQTKLADEVVTMRRMRPLPTISIVGGDGSANADTGVNELDIRSSDPLYTEHVDGQLVLNKYVGLPVKYSDWWNIEAFHGSCIPRFWMDYSLANDGNVTDPDWEPRKPWESYSDLYQQSRVLAPGISGFSQNNVLDILAYHQREIPFLPCVPKYIDDTDFAGARVVNNRLNQFARKGKRIKIKSNYMRFNFYVKPGMNGVTPELSGKDDYISHHPGPIEGESYSRGIGGKVISYKISAKSVAKARIIVVKRSDFHDAPINLNDFLKDNNPYSMGDEFYRMGKYFNRKYKTDNDIVVQPNGDETISTEVPNEGDTKKLDYEVTKLKDISNETQRGLHNVTIMYDKVHNLRIGGETQVKLSLMKGTVLTYEDRNPAKTELYVDEDGVYRYVENQQTAAVEIKNISLNNDKLPVSTNEVLRDLNMDPADLNHHAERNEYVPIGAKYAAFLLLMNQKCSTEYQIFQKFEFDN